MLLYQFKNHRPVISENVFIAQSAVIIGQCQLDQGVNIWYNCVLRADVNKIFIGENTNIQDLSMLHVTEENTLILKENISVGHSVTLHGCIIEKGCLIGMGATILDNAHIQENSLVAAGSLVPPGKIYPKNSMIMGNPAKVIRELTTEEIFMVSNHYKSYLGYAKSFQKDLKPI